MLPAVSAAALAADGAEAPRAASAADHTAAQAVLTEDRTAEVLPRADSTEVPAEAFPEERSPPPAVTMAAIIMAVDD